MFLGTAWLGIGILIAFGGIVLADLLGLAVACQLLGLLDVLGDPTFLQRGGWFQPVTSASFSSIPTLVTRFSMNSALFLATAVALSIPSKESSTGEGVLDESAVSSKKALVKTTLQMTVAFCMVRALLAVVVLTWSTISFDGSSNSITDWYILVEAARECYFVFLGTTTARFALYWLYYRDDDT